MISAFTFGGGYVIVPLMQKRFVTQLGWISEEDMLEIVTLAQSSPGALSLNCAALVGYNMAGLPGALTGLFGTALPPVIILSIVSYIYGLIQGNSYIAAMMRGMQAGIAAIIADAVYGMARPFLSKKGIPSIAIMILAFIASWFLGINIAIIILAAGFLGALSSLLQNRRGKGGGGA